MTVQDDEWLAGQAMEAKAYEEAVRLLRPLAERNSEYALLTLGWIYETGATGTPDQAAARAYYEHAAAQGSAAAYRSLGRVLLNGGQEQEARAAFERGAQLNDDECKSELNEMLASEALKLGAYEEAVRLLRPLAERNSEYALLTLGWIYETGATGTPDQAAARAFYERAAAQGSAAAYHSLGGVLLNSGQELEARAAFERGAQLNNDECKSELTRLADHADEMLVSRALKQGAYEEAVRLLRPLAERNSEYALLALGWIYETGATGTPDWEVARSYYERAASLGSTDGYFELGRLLKRQGEEEKARAAFRVGAERGHLPSMSRLGEMMVEGRGGPIDFDAGFAWLEKAAAEGHFWAQRKLLAINAKTIFEKLSFAMRIVGLGIRAAREMSKDPSSDKVR